MILRNLNFASKILFLNSQDMLIILTRHLILNVTSYYIVLFRFEKDIQVQ